jgi:hypothetical protein
MLIADLRGRLRVNDPEAPVDIELVAGLGLTNLGGALFDLVDGDGLDSPSVPTGVVGVGGVFALTDRIRLRVSFEDYIHDGNLIADEGLYSGDDDRRFQHDLLWSAGIVLPFSLD